ncbi:hypothetical protein ATO7_05285 [Oceanococcus atlanticus]|uniref:Uncharacterized protein n=1 Tax=Oceanococcus atlanticus TaxID=1317117 RepID=A0A1Y1SHZ1_9GAMM|nr:hypothetical protein [Oceanococcus atlanticus]ORE89266.1 hypothetical protein ATO7_05285 [Oceanococcus atlanticus]
MKSRVIAVRLGPDELDTLSAMPGETTTEKIRLLIQSQAVVDAVTDQITTALASRLEAFEERVEVMVRGAFQRAEQTSRNRHDEVAEWVGRLGKAIIQRLPKS